MVKNNVYILLFHILLVTVSVALVGMENLSPFGKNEDLFSLSIFLRGYLLLVVNLFAYFYLGKFLEKQTSKQKNFFSVSSIMFLNFLLILIILPVGDLTWLFYFLFNGSDLPLKLIINPFLPEGVNFGYLYLVLDVMWGIIVTNLIYIGLEHKK